MIYIIPAYLLLKSKNNLYHVFKIDFIIIIRLIIINFNACFCGNAAIFNKKKTKSLGNYISTIMCYTSYYN